MGKKYQICTKTIMDTSDPDIVFDKDGISNHFYRYEEIKSKIGFESNEARRRACDNLISKIKKDGSVKKYNCVIGVSGGVDSTYVAYLAKKEFGLNPLAVHFDNGWNSELAVKNIENTLNILNIDLHTYVINWEEFKSLQLAFLEASTPDGEVPTDHAIISTLYGIAAKFDIKYILNGVNFQSESIMPIRWGYGYYDLSYIKDVNSKFGNSKLKTYPKLSLSRLAYYSKIKGIKFIPILNYVEYRKEDAMQIIKNSLGWVYYGGKHYESIYTRFYQAHLLLKKFNIDKRRSHYSNLICSGQMERDEALELIKVPAYNSNLEAQDLEYFLKKLELTQTDYNRIMNKPIMYFTDYRNNKSIVDAFKRLKQH